jgi:hypothetical protein
MTLHQFSQSLPPGAAMSRINNLVLVCLDEHADPECHSVHKILADRPVTRVIDDAEIGRLVMEEIHP